MEWKFGAWIDNENIEVREKTPVFSPYDGRKIGEVGVSDELIAGKAIESAVNCFRKLKEMPVYEKSEILMNLARILERRKKEFAEVITLDAGKPINFSLQEVERAILTFTLAAEESRREKGEIIPVDIDKRFRSYFCFYITCPSGPVLGISPFNFPLNLVAHKLAPAFAAGCSLVLKTPPQAPITPFLLAHAFREAGAPPGAFNVLHLEIPLAETLVKDERFKVLSFTGSARVGWHLKGIAGKKKVILELGGNAGAIVHEDAKNISWIARRLALGGYAYAGQICISVQRIFVHEKIYRDFVDRFIEEVKKLPVGDPVKEETVVGPVIDGASADRIEEWVMEAERKNAGVLLKGKREGNIVYPWVFENAEKTLKISCEEVFGPVTVLYPYSEFEKAIHFLNDSRYGLQAGVFTQNLNNIYRAVKDIDAGGIIVNDYPTLRADNYPYGGVKDSGLGREGVRYAMREMSELKTVVINFQEV